MATDLPTFEEWYKSNKNYYKVKHEGDEDEMLRDAMNAFNSIRSFMHEPKPEPKKSKRKKKPNPYGFDT